MATDPMPADYLVDLAHELALDERDKLDWLADRSIARIAFLRVIDEMESQVRQARVLGYDEQFVMGGVLSSVFQLGYEAAIRREGLEP